MLEIDILVASLIFAVGGVIILMLFVYEQARMYLAARRRILERVSTLVLGPRSGREDIRDFTKPIANPRADSSASIQNPAT